MFCAKILDMVLHCFMAAVDGCGAYVVRPSSFHSLHIFVCKFVSLWDAYSGCL